MPKVSIIIPVYNAEEYLSRCLDSVCNQTLEDIEIICINDCSTDKSAEILELYSKKYSNIIIANTIKNSGESAARNLGLDMAQGDYLAFVDNDDTIDIDFCEKLYNIASTENADIAKGEVHIIGYDGKESYSHLNNEIREHNSILYFAYYWWTAIYKSSIVKKNNIRFIEGYPLGGDVLFLNEVILTSKTISFNDTALYHYYRRENSGDSKVLTLDKIKSVLNIHYKIMQNTNNICSYNDIGCAFINKWCMEAGLQYAYRRKTKETLLFCIDKIFDFYKIAKNKEKLLSDLEEKYSCITNFIKQGDKQGLINFYLKYDTPAKFCAALIREKMNRKNLIGVTNE